MTGYYKLKHENISKLPKESINVEEKMYDLVCPLVVENRKCVPRELLLLYDMLEVPVISVQDYSNFNYDNYEGKNDYLRELQEFFRMNERIEMLEEGHLGHLLRVSKTAYDLARELNLSKKECKNIYMAALLHDTGKYLIPDDILSKRDKLSEKEYRIMKKHTDYAYDILHDFLREDVLDTILSHHERVDGSGYPSGCTPSRDAKVLAIADSFDTMVSNRVYKKSKSVREALDELEECTIKREMGGKGELYDRDMVERFVDMKKRDGFLGE